VARIHAGCTARHPTYAAVGRALFFAVGAVRRKLLTGLLTFNHNIGRRVDSEGNPSSSHVENGQSDLLTDYDGVAGCAGSVSKKPPCFCYPSLRQFERRPQATKSRNLRDQKSTRQITSIEMSKSRRTNPLLLDSIMIVGAQPAPGSRRGGSAVTYEVKCVD
jgi:hypothetical protein